MHSYFCHFFSFHFESFGNETVFDFCPEHVESSGDRKEKPSSADRRTESPYMNNRESLSSQQPLTNKLMAPGKLNHTIQESTN